MAKVVRPKTYQGHTFKVVSNATMQEILNKRAEQAQRRADAKAAAAISNEQKTRGRKPKPKVEVEEAPVEIAEE